MIRAALLACSTAAVRINCTVAVPRRIRAGDRVAARVDVAVAGAAAESLVVELRAAGPVVFGPGAPGLDPPGDAGDDDVIYAVRGERRRACAAPPSEGVTTSAISFNQRAIEKPPVGGAVRSAAADQ